MAHGDSTLTYGDAEAVDLITEAGLEPTQRAEPFQLSETDRIRRETTTASGSENRLYYP